MLALSANQTMNIQREGCLPPERWEAECVSNIVG